MIAGTRSSHSTTLKDKTYAPMLAHYRYELIGLKEIQTFFILMLL